MAWTKATYLTRTREWMDAVDSSRWSDAFLLALLGLKGREEWEGLLDASPYWRFTTRATTTDASGQIALSALSSGSGDSQENLYKIVTVTDGSNIVYRETDFRSVPLATVQSVPTLEYDRAYYLIGQTMQVLPVGSGLSITVGVNYTPTPIDQLSADSVEFDFPTGYENVIALSAAADALAKGGAETQATGDLRVLANEYRRQLYASVQNRTANPMVLTPTDNAIWWGA